MSMYDEDNYIPETYYIPGNVTDNGNVAGGMLKLRNLIEAIVLGLIMLALWRLIFYPFGLIVKTIGFGLTVMPVVAFALIGIKGESLLEWCIEFIYFQKKKRVMIFEIPRPESIKKKRFGKKGKNVEETARSDNSAANIDDQNMSQQELKKLKREKRKQARLEAKQMEKEAREAKKAEKEERKKAKKDKAGKADKPDRADKANKTDTQNDSPTGRSKMRMGKDKPKKSAKANRKQNRGRPLSGNMH